jgi:Ca2+-binding EF-hand superfamily protein
MSSIGGISSSYYQSLFSKIDTNSDSKITKDELNTVLSESGASTTSINNLFNLLDGNSDGSVTNSELQTVQSLMQTLNGSMPPPPPPPPDDSSSSDKDKAMFNTLDKNGDSKIDSSELGAMLANGPQSSLGATDIMGLADTDGDGSISQSEFISTKDKVHEAMMSSSSAASASSGSSGNSAINDFIASLLDAVKNSSSSGVDSTTAERLTQMLQGILSSYSESDASSSKVTSSSLLTKLYA